MLTKYIAPIMGVALLASGGVIWYKNNQIADLNKEIGQLDGLLLICQNEQSKLVTEIEKQNISIDKFNQTLLSTEKKLETIETQNKILQKKTTEKVLEIQQVEHESCEQTMDWMLEEATTNENFTDVIAID